MEKMHLFTHTHTHTHTHTSTRTHSHTHSTPRAHHLLRRSYNLWLVFYFTPLLLIFLYEALARGVAHPIVQLLSTPAVYVEIGAEICIANVIISDVMYATLME
jgi:hypothetical protein